MADRGYSGQIFVARSTDQGVTWTSTRVTDGTQHSAYPEIAVAANGTIGVLYIDFVDNGVVTQFRHRFARSFDNGATWNDQILQSMNPAGLAGAASGFLWGDYEGLTALGNTFYGVYTGQATGRTTAQLDPIFFRDSAFAVPPKIQVTSPLVFPDSCGVAVQTATLNVCNTGGGPSDGPSDHVVLAGLQCACRRSGGFPLQRRRRFVLSRSRSPSRRRVPGPVNATLTIPSDDPSNLSTCSVAVQANVGAANRGDRDGRHRQLRRVVRGSVGLPRSPDHDQQQRHRARSTVTSIALVVVASISRSRRC